MTQNTALVIGDGWSALAAAGWLGSHGTPVRWVSGTGSRLFSPLPALPASPGVLFWTALAKALGIDCGEALGGSFLREFRNKGFREPLWIQAPTPADREDVFSEVISSSESRICGPFEKRFKNWSFLDLEEEIRTRVFALPNVSRVDGAALSQLTWAKGGVGLARLASGEEISFSQAFYADHWNSLIEIAGLPKTLNSQTGKWRLGELERKLHPQGVLQLVLHHEPAVENRVDEGFLIELNRESGEQIQKHALGGFSSDGKRSLWTLVLDGEESQDHPLIAKRLRRIKQALNKTFVGSEWHGTKKEFLATVVNEAVRLEDNVLFGSGEVSELPLSLDGTQTGAGVFFLTDGFGPAAAGVIAAGALGLSLAVTESGAEPQANPVNPNGPSEA